MSCEPAAVAAVGIASVLVLSLLLPLLLWCPELHVALAVHVLVEDRLAGASCLQQVWQVRQVWLIQPA
jgi:hypothetical protein